MNQIHHLFQRAGFGLSPQEWQERKNWSIPQAVDFLFKNTSPIKLESNDAPSEDLSSLNKMSKEEVAARRKKERQLVAQHNIAWINRMANPGENAFLERMTLFWHGHFACKTKISGLAIDQINTIRQHALGNFRDLVLAMAKDVSMIRFLNNQQNRKNKPNENFARELLELFTIGRGNYTEQDIKEAARAFTGWSSNIQGQYVFRKRQHDYGQKTFFGKTGDFNGEEIIALILEKKETAYFITKKIYRYFVNEEPNEEIITQLSQAFYNSNYNIGHLLRTIFESDWFYSPENIGAKIKSPVELLAGMMRSLNVKFEQDKALLFVQKASGPSPVQPSQCSWLARWKILD